MIIFLDNLLLYTRLLVILGQLFGGGCRLSCSCGRDSLGRNVSVVIHSIHLFEHFSGSDQLSVAEADKV